MGKKHPCLCRNSSCDKEGLPGQVGLFSDKTVQFVSDPSKFVEKTCLELGSRIFTCRLATKQTIVIADYKVLTQFLHSSQKDFRTGLNDFSELFGESIMFAEEETALALKNILLPLFSQQSVISYQPVLHQELDSWSSNLDCDRGLNLYEEIKNLSLAYNVNIFMGVKKSENPELFDKIKDLASIHWHGFVSLPTNFSVPFLGQGGYKKAMEAKIKLLEIIKRELTQNGSAFFENFKNNKNELLTDEILYNHMLMFSCALIPKAVGSVIVMFFELMHKWRHLMQEDGTLEQSDLQCILLEVMRMYPPFIGNVKIAKVDTKIGDWCCPSGTAVFYNFMGAMRDPSSFLYPDEFMPNRWRTASEAEKHLAWGGGLHSCVGRVMSWDTLLTIITHILRHFTVTRQEDHLLDGVNVDIKHLPVLRPSTATAFRFKRK